METLDHAAPPGQAWSRGAAPLVSGAAIGAAAIYVAVVTPGSGRTIPCPFHAATGLWCPGCGMTRAVHHLLRGNLPEAISLNIFVPIVVIATLIGWWSWLGASLWSRPVRWPGRVANRWWFGLFGLFVAYGVVRNLPGFDALAP